MKLITAIINKKDSTEVGEALTNAGFSYTRMATVGGFLTAGNMTLMIGIDDEKVENVLEIIRNHCSTRTELVPTAVQSTSATFVQPTKVAVGGAIVFVTPVEYFEKM